MDRPDGVDYGLILYVVGVIGVGGLVIGLLWQLSLRRIPEFTERLVANPTAAGREDPLAVALVVGTILATLLLVALIVGFGARYGVAETERRRE